MAKSGILVTVKRSCKCHRCDRLLSRGERAVSTAKGHWHPNCFLDARGREILEEVDGFE